MLFFLIMSILLFRFLTIQSYRLHRIDSIESRAFREFIMQSVIGKQTSRTKLVCIFTDVIIIPASQKLLIQAQRLKEFHEQHDGLRVTIVPADELYNEFSSGTPDGYTYTDYTLQNHLLQ